MLWVWESSNSSNHFQSKNYEFQLYVFSYFIKNNLIVLISEKKKGKSVDDATMTEERVVGVGAQ